MLKNSYGRYDLAGSLCFPGQFEPERSSQSNPSVVDELTKISTHNEAKLAILSFKNEYFAGEGAQPFPQTSLQWGARHPSPHPTHRRFRHINSRAFDARLILVITRFKFNNSIIFLVQ